VFGDQMQQYGAEEQQNQSFWQDLGGVAGTLLGGFQTGGSLYNMFGMGGS
jgi:hypothetical protein